MICFKILNSMIFPERRHLKGVENSCERCYLLYGIYGLSRTHIKRKRHKNLSSFKEKKEKNMYMIKTFF